ncbi:ARM repeat superfamily protein [Zea mays]|uniref:ARM repeat superfamily protein n=1 Tax=Zea mays TaxID=4577 RepID=A0A1D6ML08_MAIZE|nr:ARM repeat superfamily protein [Zea mays]ONM29896.1 ARM repeat superfamily protein [Zea mays]
MACPTGAADRSLFTPYFKYLLEGSIQYLSEDDALGGSKHKKKKTKLVDVQVEQKDKLLGLKLWNLRALVLKSLHQCFLYDNDQKILDSSNFQVLLKPIVSQFVVEPPKSVESVLDAPSIEEVDETIILCLGQMAVLMQTRSDEVRPKMLGLKVIRYMVQHLKEEYVVLVPETIPFLGELLEDVELPVKTLSQEILKEMETLSGESLQQYL